MSELKPCPFVQCGAIPVLVNEKHEKPLYFMNHVTGCPCNKHYLQPSEIEFWNTRTTDTELTRLKRKVEVLREGFSKIADENNDDCVHCIANEAIAAADRIAKEQPHDKD